MGCAMRWTRACGSRFPLLAKERCDILARMTSDRRSDNKASPGRRKGMRSLPPSPFQTLGASSAYGMDNIPNNRLTLVFPDLPYFRITREHTALIVVDMQKADAHPDYGLGVKARQAGIEKTFEYYWGAVARAVEQQKQLLDAARAAGVQVVFTRIATQTRTARDVGNQHRYVNLAVPKDS